MERHVDRWKHDLSVEKMWVMLDKLKEDFGIANKQKQDDKSDQPFGSEKPRASLSNSDNGVKSEHYDVHRSAAEPSKPQQSSFKSKTLMNETISSEKLEKDGGFKNELMRLIKKLFFGENVKTVIDQDSSSYKSFWIHSGPTITSKRSASHQSLVHDEADLCSFNSISSKSSVKDANSSQSNQSIMQYPKRESADDNFKSCGASPTLVQIDSERDIALTAEDSHKIDSVSFQSSHDKIELDSDGFKPPSVTSQRSISKTDHDWSSSSTRSSQIKDNSAGVTSLDQSDRFQNGSGLKSQSRSSLLNGSNECGTLKKDESLKTDFVTSSKKLLLDKEIINITENKSSSDNSFSDHFESKLTSKQFASHPSSVHDKTDFGSFKSSPSQSLAKNASASQNNLSVKHSHRRDGTDDNFKSYAASRKFKKSDLNRDLDLTAEDSHKKFSMFSKPSHDKIKMDANVFKPSPVMSQSSTSKVNHGRSFSSTRLLQTKDKPSGVMSFNQTNPSQNVLGLKSQSSSSLPNSSYKFESLVNAMIGSKKLRNDEGFEGDLMTSLKKLSPDKNVINVTKQDSISDKSFSSNSEPKVTSKRSASRQTSLPHGADIGFSSRQSGSWQRNHKPSVHDGTNLGSFKTSSSKPTVKEANAPCNNQYFMQSQHRDGADVVFKSYAASPTLGKSDSEQNIEATSNDIHKADSIFSQLSYDETEVDATVGKSSSVTSQLSISKMDHNQSYLPTRLSSIKNKPADVMSLNKSNGFQNDYELKSQSKSSLLNNNYKSKPTMNATASLEKLEKIVGLKGDLITSFKKSPFDKDDVKATQRISQSDESFSIHSESNASLKRFASHPSSAHEVADPGSFKSSTSKSTVKDANTSLSNQSLMQSQDRDSAGVECKLNAETPILKKANTHRDIEAEAENSYKARSVSSQPRNDEIELDNTICDLSSVTSQHSNLKEHRDESYSSSRTSSSKDILAIVTSLDQTDRSQIVSSELSLEFVSSLGSKTSNKSFFAAEDDGFRRSASEVKTRKESDDQTVEFARDTVSLFSAENDGFRRSASEVKTRKESDDQTVEFARDTASLFSAENERSASEVKTRKESDDQTVEFARDTASLFSAENGFRRSASEVKTRKESDDQTVEFARDTACLVLKMMAFDVLHQKSKLVRKVMTKRLNLPGIP